ncbi:hypothetical protein LC065_16955 [Halobacillus litoralis]|uniref:hypothetical protein n=1 Tax=Halobacillus litoralis TaxID=45668 RepID=UPI00273EAC5D|nr:hypothetical protein [Halobacillus litoralis]WLR47191.1 hypothetical protein LC065_16955 [Halobacillus litoralis]
MDELESIMKRCLEKKKDFLPAVVLGAYGMAGPYINETSEKDWQSAWHSLPEHMKSESPSFIASRPAQSMLSTVMVFELFKKMTGVQEPHQTKHIYLMNMETLEGRWHPFKPHPLATQNISTEKMNIEEGSLNHVKDQNEWLYYFGELTASPLGIFYQWEEGDLEQLPLSLCGVQVVHARSQKLTPEIIAGGKTHEEARREAGFMGVEAYAKTLEGEILQSLVPHAESPRRFPDDAFHIGAGESYTESSLRALQKAVENVWTEDHHKAKKARKFTLRTIEDEDCRYYWQVLKTMDKEPELAISEDGFGFPMVWVKTPHSKWRGTVALHQTLAVRQALFLLLMEKQMEGLPTAYSFRSCSQLYFEKESMASFDLPSMEAKDNKEVLRGAVTQLEKGQHKPSFVKISMDPFEEDGVIDLCGVWLERGDSV